MLKHPTEQLKKKKEIKVPIKPKYPINVHICTTYMTHSMTLTGVQ